MKNTAIRVVPLLVLALGAGPVLGQETPADARRHVEYLAADELEGRGTGTAGAAKAADYLIACPAIGCALQVSIVLRQVTVEVCRDRPLQRVEGILSFY